MGVYDHLPAVPEELGDWPGVLPALPYPPARRRPQDNAKRRAVCIAANPATASGACFNATG